METREEHYASMMQAVQRYAPSADLEEIQKAYEYADRKHKDQLRKSGEPYIIHPLKTALACFVFGYTEAISVSLQSVGLPSQVVISVPYLITVLVMFVSAVVEKCKLKMAKAR